MSPTPPHASSDAFARSELGDHPIHARSSVSWGAIFAGATAALALHVLFMMLGAGLGMILYSPVTAENPVSNLSTGALIIQSISAIVSLCLGGWVAGRFTPARSRRTAWLHGFSVWCAATVSGVILLTIGASVMLGGLTNMAGSGLFAAAEGAGNLAAEAMDQSSKTIESFVDEAVSELPENQSASKGIRATREVTLAVGRFFNPAFTGDTRTRRADAVAALAEHTDMSQAEADQTITEWTATFERLKTDLVALQDAAVEQARQAADDAAGALATVSLWSFFGFLLGALAAAWGGLLGAKAAIRCEETNSEHNYA